MQFEADGDGYIYRRYQKGPAVRVTEAERDGFLSEFDKSRARIDWMLYAGTGLLLITTLALERLNEGPTASSLSSVVFITVGGLLVTLPYAICLRSIWNAPARALKNRCPVGRER